MISKIKHTALISLGFLLVFIGAVFVILPGPAFLFLPIGLAILSLKYTWAKKWLKKCQRWMSASAKKMDSWLWQIKKTKF